MTAKQINELKEKYGDIYELPVEDKKAWVKKLKDDVKTGKKEIIRENGIVVGYRVKDRKTIRNEDFHKEVYKKVNNL